MTAEFATQKPMSVRGAITKVMWANPHPWIYVDVKGADGRIENWGVETGSTARMINRGLKREDLALGIEVIVGGYQARDGGRKMAGMVVTFPDREKAGKEATFALGR
jgi:hypothetical protein